MLAFCAGIIYFSCGFTVAAKVPQSVTVNGVEVGGLKRSEAAQIIRRGIESELKEKALKVRAGDTVYTYQYPEIYYKDNLYNILKYAERGQSYTADISYYLCGANEVAAGICQSLARLKVEPYAEFSAFGKPFTYFEGNDGVEANKSKLIEDINKSLNGNFETVTAEFKRIPRKKSLEEIKAATRLLCSFTTYYDKENLNRASNIRLAAAKLNGTVLKRGETLSFNDIVGARVKERGFLPAKIIENGEFIEGVGGGVCQVSTTLYNAAVLSGLKIAEYHPHSLAVGYVAPSRDAMVSGSAFDLKIKNDFETPIYIRANTSNGSVTFDIYGAGDGAEYSLISSVTGSVPAPEELTDDPAKAREGKDGTLSEGYLVITRDGYRKSTLIRKDKYLPVKRVILNGVNTQDAPPQPGEDEKDAG